jgi:hypothetical protein
MLLPAASIAALVLIIRTRVVTAATAHVELVLAYSIMEAATSTNVAWTRKTLTLAETARNFLVQS